MSIFHDIVDFVGLELTDIINGRGEWRGKVTAYRLDEETKTITFDISFNGWYSREKIIDDIYRGFDVDNTTEISVSTSEIKVVYREGGEWRTKHIADVVINWTNTAKEDKVPEIMQNLLSGVSFSQYQTF